MRNLRMAIGVLVLAGALAVSGCIFTNSPVANFTATPEFDYPPLEVTFDASASSSPNGTIVSYEWDFGDDEAGSGVTVEHTYTEKGTYSVTLVVTDSAGAIAARTRRVEALNRVPSAIFVEHAVRLAADILLEFDASGSSDPDGEIVEYEWDFGDGWRDYGEVVEHSYPREDAFYTVTLTVFDEDDAFAKYSRQIEIGCCGGY